MPSELDALRAAKLLLDQHGAQEAWRILIARAVQEYTANDMDLMAITLQVLAALDKLTLEPDGKTRH